MNARSSLTFALVCAAGLIAAALVFAPAAGQSSASVYEVRSYHFEPDRLGDYRAWMKQHGLPYLSGELDVVGFWINDGIPAEVQGAPLDQLGAANITWIIRWDSKEQRDVRWPEVTSTDEWREIFAKLEGGPSGYRRIEARFLEEV